MNYKKLSIIFLGLMVALFTVVVISFRSLVSDPDLKKEIETIAQSSIEPYLPKSRVVIGSIDASGLFDIEVSDFKILAETGDLPLLKFAQVIVDPDWFSLLSQPNFKIHLREANSGEINLNVTFDPQTESLKSFVGEFRSIDLKEFLAAQRSDQRAQLGSWLVDGTLRHNKNQFTFRGRSTRLAWTLKAPKALKKIGAKIPDSFNLKPFPLNLTLSPRGIRFDDPIVLASSFGKITLKGGIARKQNTFVWRAQGNLKGKPLLSFFARSIFRCKNRPEKNFKLRGPLEEANCRGAKE
jgi:hypothetical protein